MKLEEYIKSYNKSFEDIKTEYPEDFNQLFEEDRVWLGNIDNKLHLLNDKESEEKFRLVIDKLKSNVNFSEADTELLTVFNAKVDKIVNIVNFINNFKENTQLENNTELKLYQLFNSIKSANNLKEFDFKLNSNLNNFLPHLFSIIKHCQDPNQFPVFYKLWRNIIRETLGKKDDYDSICLFYREFPLENRHLYFGAYLGTISLQIAKNVKEYFPNITFESKEYKYLVNNVINLKRYKKILDESMDLYQLKRNFLKEWPLSRIQTMKLEEYTNLDKTSFCYWLEAKTNDLGSIWGGSSYKFGIYKRRDIDTPVVEKCRTDGEYAWFQKYGETKEAAFETIRGIIIAIINYTQNNELDKIDTIDLGDAYKWKIAFLYGDFNVVNIYKKESLLEAAQSLKYKDDSKAYSALNKYILSQKASDKDYFEFTDELWKKTSLANPTKYWLYAPGENANKWEEFYNQGIMGLGWDALGDLDDYLSKNEIKAKLQELEGVSSTKQNDTAANYDFHRVIKPGDVIIVKKGISELLGYGIVTSDYFYDENKESYQKCRKVDWKSKGNWKVDLTLAQKTLTDITKYPTQDTAYAKYYEKLLGIMEGNTSIKSNDMDDTNLYNAPLNQILYGPPGTGKTYHTINKALSIIENKSIDVLKRENRKDLKKRYDQYIKEGRIVFTTFHQSMSYEDFIEGIKPRMINNTVEYHIKQGVFKKISNLESFSKAYAYLKNYIGKELPMKTGKAIVHEVNDNQATIKRITDNKLFKFEKSEIRNAYIECLKTPKEINKHKISKAEFGSLLEFLLNKENRLSYVLIIDEINRGNVSQIFGELITLIEEDKRLGKDEALEVTLPYSKEKFGVPPNLYIIGTMNTADRSVEALDTALRRRFSFEEMPPRSKVVEEKGFGDYPRAAIMEKINNRIELLLDRNHTLGHAYFIKENFKNSFENEIIPLLQEYFYNDYGKIGLVLGKGFVRDNSITKSNGQSIFADFETKNEVDIVKSYELIPFAEVEFETALQTLLA